MVSGQYWWSLVFILLHNCEAGFGWGWWVGLGFHLHRPENISHDSLLPLWLATAVSIIILTAARLAPEHTDHRGNKTLNASGLSCTQVGAQHAMGPQ